MNSKNNELMLQRIKILLTISGLNERYKRFDCIADLLCLMIKTNDDSYKMFKEYVYEYAKTNNISPNSTIGQISLLLKQCKDEVWQISTTPITPSTRTYRKITVLLQYIKNKLKMF